MSDWITQRVVDVYSKQGSGERLVSFKRGRRINLAQCHKAVFPSRITGNVLRNTAGPHSVRTFLVVSHPATFFDCYFYADAAKKNYSVFSICFYDEAALLLPGAGFRGDGGRVCPAGLVGVPPTPPTTTTTLGSTTFTSATHGT